MSNEEAEEFAKELEKSKKEPLQKVKRICPFCSGNMLKKEKVILNNKELSIEIREDLGLLILEIYDENDEQIYKSNFSIKYCPICGRKIKNKYKKIEK